MGFSSGSDWVLIQGAEGFQDSPLTPHVSATKKVWEFVVAWASDPWFSCEFWSPSRGLASHL